MGYLGLDGPPVEDDNLLQRLFWPSDHAGETDQLGQQGFWFCVSIAIVTCLRESLRGHPILGLMSAVFYILGGIGVREHSQPAAVLVAVAYVLNLIATVARGVPPGFTSLVAAVLLIANIRGTFIAARWAALDDPDAMPERMSRSFSDKLVDQMPQVVWPRAKWLFFVVGTLYMVMTILGAVFMALHITGLPKNAQSSPQTTHNFEFPASR